MKDSEDEEGTTDMALQIFKLLADERGYDAKIALIESGEVIAAAKVLRGCIRSSEMFVNCYRK